MTAKLKGYTLAQRNLAYTIRRKAIANYPWQETYPEQQLAALNRITSPMFFIKHQRQLANGQISQALSDYSDDNYARRANHVTRRNNGR
ncbi:hypothetical protein ACN08N_23725 [Photobacterium leiognathi subsp. mandapamensis]|uniref:hypothetical protein n=1 Tax=Photobacterium leiognathi TaxID=553611 RepID=UPI003AF37892